MLQLNPIIFYFIYFFLQVKNSIKPMIRLNIFLSLIDNKNTIFSFYQENLKFYQHPDMYEFERLGEGK